jgi:2-dehydropantoate 2-reductase
MTFGELDGHASPRGECLRHLCAAAGFEGILGPDIRVPLWEKFIGLVPLSGLNALTRLPLGKWRDDPELFARADASLRETLAVGLAEGVQLPSDSADRTLAAITSMPAYHMTSMATTYCAAIGSSCPGSPARWSSWAAAMAFRRR